MSGMFSNSALSCTNYSETLSGWASNNPLVTERNLGATNVTYGSLAIEARAKLTTPVAEGGMGWTILNDELGTGSADCTPTGSKPFVTIWKTDNPGTSNDDQIIIPTDGGGYDYYLHWVDVTDAAVNATVGPFTGNATLTFPAVGNYRVTIVGDFPQIYFDNSGDKDKLLRVEQWGDNPWTSMGRAFHGCSNLRITATDAPDLSLVTTMSFMLAGATSLDDDINHWDVANVEDMSSLFKDDENFNQPLNDWKVDKATTMKAMFDGAKAFNQALDQWTVTSVTDMSYMFNNAYVFDQNISNWDVSNVTSMQSMFKNARKFNQLIGTWTVDKVTNMESMFSGANYNDMVFNQDLSNWNVSNVTDMSSMFYRVSVFNQNLGSWKLDAVVNMSDMLTQTGLNCINYSATLIGWQNNNPTLTGVALGATGLNYGTNAISAREKLINDQNWTINDGGSFGSECLLFTLDAIADANVDENTDYTSVTPAIVDGTPIGTLTYTLGGSDAADFTIDPAIGVVKMIARDFEAPVDDNTDNVYELTIRATDENGNYDEESWTVEINNLNDNEPIADDESVSTAEEVNYTFASNDFSNDYSDADGNGFAGIRLTSLPGQGILKYDGITLLATDVAAPGYSIADITKLVFIPETDKSGSPYTTFDFEVYDGGSYSTSSYTMTINVTPYVPSVSLAVDNSTIAENAGVATFTASLDKSSSKDVTVTLSYSGTAIGSGTDYTTATGTNATSVTEIVIPSGSTTGSVEVTAVDDFLDENDETITVTISSPINATLSANIEVTTTITDNDATGVTVSAISGNTTEDIGSATFTVKLNSQPTADVVIALSSNDTSEGTVQASITITPSNWNTAQTVTVTGVDDDIIDGNITYKVVTGDITSADGNYSALTASDISDISVINTDNDAAGFTLSKTTATTSESGTTDNFNVVLDAQPASDVVISVTSADTGEGTVSPASLTFTPSNWNTSQMVTITGMDDNIIDGTQTYNVTLSIVDASSDNDFDVLSDQTVSVNNTDDDAPGFTISKTTATTSESGATDDFTVVLNAQPSSDVVISVTSADTGEGTVLPATLTFTSANWITAQTVTITGINDNLIDGIQNYNVTLSIVDASSDNDFDALSDQTVSVNNTDDDAAGFTLSKATATTSESGTTDNFTVVLGAQPASDVVISVTSADIGEGTVSPATLTFTPSNWNATQMVTITGVDDDLIDGTQNYNVTLSIVDASSDNDFDALSDQTVSVNNTDDDAAGFTLSKTTAATSESGTTDNFTMVLNTQPSSAVVFSITSEDTSEGKINPSESTISLTPANWNIPQSVTITGVDDFIIDGDQTYDVTVAIKNSADANYSSLSGKTVTIINTDDDSPGFEVSETTASTSESGTTDNFMINLMSQPDTDVVISITPGDTSEGTVSPATLTFTPANWNVAQSVTITGLADNIIDGVINYDITIAIVDALSDDNFDGWPSKTVAVSNVDTDTAPTASNNSNSTNEDITLTIPQASGLLSNASDADGDVLSILSFEVETVNYNPGQTANLSEGSLTINADGSYMFVPSADYNGAVPIISYIVTDGVNSDNATLTLNIIAVNDAPIFTSTPLSIATPGVLYTYNITATDTDGDALNFSMALVPDWLTLTDNGDGTATLSGTPTNDDLGNDALIVQVNDGTANVSQSFSITVSKLNEAPVFTSTPITEATEDELYNYSITASDADGDVLTISASSKPDWLSLLDNGDGTATLSGTPLNEHVGLHTISLTVSDNTLSDLQSFELEVLNTNDAPDSIIISNDRVMELMPIGTYVGELTTLDADKNDSHVYALLNADEMPFYLIGDSLHTTEELLYPERNVYELQIESTDLGGLKVVDTINIYVDQNNNIEVIIPSAFTPNNDGENDNWELPNINRYETYSIIIIDRNGNEVFSSSDYTRAWDGKFKGRQLPIGQYYYFIKTFRSGESKTFKGTVTIL
ncbi:BspA family leucine-rich repeat surface protein [Marivirga lumbricoides]